MTDSVTISIDAMGGDFGPSVTVPASVKITHSLPNLNIVFVGDEAKINKELDDLNALAERTRLEAEAAKKEVVALRNREKQLATQVDELKQRLDRGMAPVLVVSKPTDGAKIESPNTLLH